MAIARFIQVAKRYATREVIPMTKGELRKMRKANTEAGRAWNIETSASGHLETVRERTPAQERKHERAMDRWARRGGGGDFDYSMNY